MKRFLIGILALTVFLGLTAQAQAASSDSVGVKVTILSSLGVEIAEDDIDIGSVDVGTTTASASGVTVTNTSSGITQTYSLNLTNPSGWTASQTAAGAEVYVLNATFDSNGPSSWNITNHALSTTAVACSGTQFAGDDQTGLNVPYGAARKLWFQFMAPTSTTVTSEQSITVTVTAQAS